MLSDEKQFNMVEDELRKTGKLEQFETECGPITGRMMITLTDFPGHILQKPKKKEALFAFECSFDFYDCTLGIALYTDTMETVGGLWITEQKAGANPPSEEWIDFFIQTLCDAIGPDGSFGCPIYSLLNDSSDMTVVPTQVNGLMNQ